MAFTAHASRARRQEHNIGVMNPMNPWYFRNGMTEDLRVKIMNAALAQMERWGLPIEIPQYHWPIAGLAQRCHPERRQWTIDWVEKQLFQGAIWRIFGSKLNQYLFGRLKGSQTPRFTIRSMLGLGILSRMRMSPELTPEAGCSGPEGDDFEMDMGVYELYESESETHKFVEGLFFV
ncbi:hypothetical protein E4U15_007286 [Claviceps sp. LM218 group G6]|nr:hypothetical protein E4U15_007286 [Claviceps sp. LM218 group G6]